MKYCTQCGKPNANENKFCQACGKAFQEAVAQPVAQPVAQSDVQPAAQVPDGMTSTPLASTVLKESLGKVLFLVATILFSAATFFQFLYLLFEESESAQQFFSDFSSGVQTMSMEAAPSLDLSGLLLIVPYGLICVGLWMLFAQGRKWGDAPVGTAGFQVVKVGTIIHMIMLCAVFGLLLLAVTLVQFMAFFGGEMGEVAAVAIIVLHIFTIALAGALVALIFFYIKTLKLLDNAKRTATAGMTDFKVSKFLIVVCYVLGGTYVLDAFSSIGSTLLGFLGSGCEAAFLFVIAICLTNYKNELAMLQNYLAQEGAKQG